MTDNGSQVRRITVRRAEVLREIARAIQASDFRLVNGGFGDGNVPPASIGVTSPAQPAGVWTFKFQRDPVEVPDPTVFGAKSGIREASITLADSTGKVLGATVYLHQ